MSDITALLEIKNMSKYFHGEAGAKQLVLDDINFSNDFNKQSGSIISLLAPFGSGKSTLLKIISAIEKPSAGNVYLNGNIYDRCGGQIVYIPEKASSFPWMNVKQNIEFAGSFVGKEKMNTGEIIAAVGLSGYEEHFPNPKSTGFRFRIAIARALAVKPLLILLDDPLKNLKGETKKEIYELLTDLKENLNLNFLLSTTNITEAVKLSDKVYLMKGPPGKIFKEIDLIQAKTGSDKNILYTEIRKEIESAYSGFEGVPLVSEIQ